MSNTSGPAFPVMHSIDGNWTKRPLAEFSGMTLRDYFAAKAMQAIITASSTWPTAVSVKSAEAAYQIADAMLKERAK